MEQAMSRVVKSGALERVPAIGEGREGGVDEVGDKGRNDCCNKMTFANPRDKVAPYPLTANRQRLLDKEGTKPSMSKVGG